VLKGFKIVLVLTMVMALAGCNTMLSEQDIPRGEDEASDPAEFADMISNEHLYDEADQGSILVKSDDLSGLEPLLEELDSEVLNEYPQIDWAQIAVPTGQEMPEFLQEARKLEQIVLAQPNLPQKLPEYQERTDQEVLEYTEQDLDVLNIGADDYDKYLWGMESINAPGAWEITTGSDEVVVAIIDTGVQMDHPEFAENEFVAPFNATDDGWPEGDVTDLSGHGTHVAGTAVADGRTGNIAGVSWDNPIMPIRVMNYVDGVILSTYTIEGILHIVDYMQEHDVRVVANYSIGGRGYDPAMKDALDYALDEGLIWVTSAGNDGKRVPNLPATYNGLISVAASTPWDDKADFSTTGSWNSVAAPGVNIWSTVPGEDYAHMQGTSMSSPHVTGAVALLLSENPDLTAVEVLNQVEQTARGEGFTEELGHGILDVEALLGDIHPVNYGGVDVQTNLPGAQITVFDDNGNMVGFAAVGPDLIRRIHALEAGDYTVNLTFIDPETWETETLQEDITIVPEDVLEIEMEF